MSAFTEDDKRVYLKLAPHLAPYQVAVFPLLGNKPELTARAREVYQTLKDSRLSAIWDGRGNIGKRYYSQDEIGTPWCVTVDFQTLEDSTVTVRDRDTASQIRLPISELTDHINSQL